MPFCPTEHTKNNFHPILTRQTCGFVPVKANSQLFLMYAWLLKPARRKWSRNRQTRQHQMHVYCVPWMLLMSSCRAQCTVRPSIILVSGSQTRTIQKELYHTFSSGIFYPNHIILISWAVLLWIYFILRAHLNKQGGSLVTGDWIKLHWENYPFAVRKFKENLALHLWYCSAKHFLPGKKIL